MAYMDYSKIIEKPMKTHNNAMEFEMGNKQPNNSTASFGNMNVRPSSQVTKNAAIVVKWLGKMPNEDVARASGHPITRINTMSKLAKNFAGMTKSQLEIERETLFNLIDGLKGLSRYAREVDND